MRITVERFLFEDETTLGILKVDGKFHCFTLEDIPRHAKIKGQTCIACGEYEIELTSDNKWKRLMPLLKNVKDFIGVYIHWGNKKEDTEGCLITGTSIGNTKEVIGSKIAFESLMEKILAVWGKEKITIVISNYVVPEPL